MPIMIGDKATVDNKSYYLSVDSILWISVTFWMNTAYPDTKIQIPIPKADTINGYINYPIEIVRGPSPSIALN